MKLKKKLSLLLLGMVLCSTASLAQTKIIAHRGYWDCKGSAQNSIASLQKAAEENLYGSEFDVSITSDGVLVVNHDPTIQGIEIENSPYSAIKNLKLSNNEKLPTLKDYLTEGKKHKDLKLILEIKPHKKEINENRAVKAIIDMVKDMNIGEQVEYISFSKNICQQLRSLDSTIKIAYLDGDLAPAEAKELGCTGIDYYMDVLKKNPQWINQSKEIGLTVNVWTVNNEEDIKSFIDRGVDFVTTNNPVKALELAK